MGQILLAYGLCKETATAISMLNKTRKAIFYIHYGDTNVFDIVAGVLQRDTH